MLLHATYNQTGDFNTRWTILLYGTYILIATVAVIVSYFANHEYQNCSNTLNTVYDERQCEPLQMMSGQYMFSQRWTYYLLDNVNYTQQPITNCRSDMQNGTTLMFFQTPFVPYVKYNITLNCDHGFNLQVVNNNLWSVYMFLRDQVDSVRKNYKCSIHNALCCSDSSNTSCSYNCTSSGEDIIGFQIKDPAATNANIYSASRQCHTYLMKNISDALGKIVEADATQIHIDANFKCYECVTVKREGWPLLWLMVVGCISIVSLAVRVSAFVAKYFYLKAVEYNEINKESTLLKA